MPDEHQVSGARLERALGTAGRARAVADYIAGMTDRYCIARFTDLAIPEAARF